MTEAKSDKSGRVTVADRTKALMRHLAIEAAHFGTAAPMEMAQFLAADRQAVSSLTLLNSARFPIGVLSPVADRMLVLTGDSGMPAAAMQQARPALGEAEFVEFENYSTAVWTDMAADHTDRIAAAMLEFLGRRDGAQPATRISAGEHQGEAGGITYRIDGTGPALLLYPAALAPSQWDPLVDRLAEEFSVIRLGGPHLGIVAMLEARGADPSYRRVLRGMLRDAAVEPTDRLLEVGCGSGVITRWLAREKLCARPITGFDLNPFMLREAAALADHEGLGDAIEFREGNAEALPFADNSFDAVLSVTVIEECDADQAIGEMARVVRPGGRVAIKVRACDMPVFWNLPVEPAIKLKAEAPIRQVAPAGCADAGLMGRLKAAGLGDVVAYPAFHGARVMQSYYEPVALSHLDATEQATWQAAKATAKAEGTFYMMHPVHCAIGVKPT